MLLKKLSQENVAFCKNIYTSSFPNKERREWEDIISLNSTSYFSFFEITFENISIGIISIWQFDNFIYIEHFAIEKELRNKGFGKKTIELIKQNISASIVLEVEIPDNDIAKKRVNFYKRCGFSLLPNQYTQPPYNSTLPSVEMRIMTTISLDFETIKSTLYKRVYNQA